MMAISMYYYNKIDMRRMQHAAHAGEKKCINAKFWHEGKGPDGKLQSRWDDVDWIKLAQDWDQ